MSDTQQAADGPPREKSSKPLRPSTAGCLAIFGAGLGHVYAGRLGFGVLLYGVGLVLSTVLMAVIVYSGFGRNGVIAAVLLGIGYRLFCITDAARSARRNKHKKRLPYQHGAICLVVWIIGCAVIGGYAILSSHLWLDAYVIPTGGMSDTLMPGDRMIAESRVLVKREIRHGDVLVFYNSGPERFIYVQRVIGLPGDVIEFKDEKLIRNSVPVDEPYARFEQDAGFVSMELRHLAPLTVAKGELFMVGDNRRLSLDSRSTGTIPVRDVIGHAMIIYFSTVPQPFPGIQPEHLGIDDNNPPGTIRWNRIGRQILNDAR